MADAVLFLLGVKSTLKTSPRQIAQKHKISVTFALQKRDIKIVKAIAAHDFGFGWLVGASDATELNFIFGQFDGKI